MCKHEPIDDLKYDERNLLRRCVGNVVRRGNQTCVLLMRMESADLNCVCSASMTLNGLLDEFAVDLQIPTGLKSAGKSFSERFDILIKNQ